MRRILVGLATGLLLAGCSSAPHHPAAARSHSPSPGPHRSATPPALVARPVADWSVRDPGPPDAIEGYTNAVSVLPGTPVRLYVSTTAPSYRVVAMRMGYYPDSWAAVVWTSPVEPGHQQPPAVTARATLTPSAPWHVSLTVPTTGWPEGDYLFRLDSSAGYQRYVPLTLRSASTAGKVVLLNAVTTWQAYNRWGGRSLYTGPGGFAGRARAVSFDRPYAFGDGAADFVGNELPVVLLAERLHLPLAYETDIDLDERPDLLAGARAVISLGHDEYYSQAMRDSLAGARDLGMNIAFLGANAIYRHIRFAATALGRDRLEIDYKDFAEDPLHLTDPPLATGPAWRSPPDPRPESVITGDYYQCNPVDADMVAVDPGNWLLAGIVTRGEHLHGLVGSEYDAVDPHAPTPEPIEVLFNSPLSCPSGLPYSDVTYYTTPNGGAVFDSGTSSWVCALAVFLCEPGHGNAAAQRVVTAITTRLLEAFAAGPAGWTHPAVSNLAALGISRPPPPGRAA
jgi:hypothetical protein